MKLREIAADSRAGIGYFFYYDSGANTIKKKTSMFFIESLQSVLSLFCVKLKVKMVFV